MVMNSHGLFNGAGTKDVMRSMSSGDLLGWKNAPMKTHEPLPSSLWEVELNQNDATRPITVTIPDIQERLRISRSEIYRLLAAGKLEAVKSGTRTLVIWDSVLSYVRNLPRATFRGGPDTER
jgi:excisionase family DNA binding protein